jgi:fermentation-respiration switch protein FrsA (DUF1100 family)
MNAWSPLVRRRRARGGAKLFVWLLEPRWPSFLPASDTPPIRTPSRDLSIETSDGERLSAGGSSRDARGEVVFFHGNGGNLSNWLPIAAGIHAQRLAVLIVDYRGYGASTGSPSESGLYRDADATLAVFWRELHRAGRPVIYWGRSLGGAPAAYATGVRAPDGVILESVFPDKASAIAGDPIFRILNLFSSWRFPTTKFLEKYRGPALVIHGDADRTIDPGLGRRVFDALQGPKRLLLIRGGDHNDVHDVDPRAYWEGVESFLSSLRPSP